MEEKWEECLMPTRAIPGVSSGLRTGMTTAATGAALTTLVPAGAGTLPSWVTDQFPRHAKGPTQPARRGLDIHGGHGLRSQPAHCP